MKRSEYLKSFRLRIFLVIVLAVLISATIMRAAAGANLRDRMVEQRIKEMTEQIRVTASRMKNYDFFHDTTSDVIIAQLSQLSTVFEGRILVIDRGFRVIADTYDISIGRYMIGEEVIRCYLGESVTNYDPGSRYVEVAVPVTEKDAETGENIVTGIILASAATDYINRTTDDIARRGWIIEIVLVVVMIGLAAGIAIMMAKPFERVSKAMGSVVSFEEDLPVVSDYKETQEIVDAFHKLRLTQPLPASGRLNAVPPWHSQLQYWLHLRKGSSTVPVRLPQERPAVLYISSFLPPSRSALVIYSVVFKLL